MTGPSANSRTKILPIVKAASFALTEGWLAKEDTDRVFRCLKFVWVGGDCHVLRVYYETKILFFIVGGAGRVCLVLGHYKSRLFERIQGRF